MTGMITIPLLGIVIYSFFNDAGSDKYPVTVIINLVILVVLAAITMISYKSIKEPQKKFHHLFLIVIYIAIIALPIYRVGYYYKEPVTNYELAAIIIAALYLFVLFYNITVYLKSKVKP